MTFSNLEIAADYLKRLARERGYLPEWYHVGKLPEEAGEAWRAFIRMSGYHRRNGTLEDFAEEVADIVISAYAVSIVKEFDLDLAIEKKHTILMSREMREGTNEMFTVIEPDGNGGWDENMAGMAMAVNPDYASARAFLEEVFDGFPFSVPPDAVEQLVDAFLPALRIICERGYAEDGATWRKAGWKPQIHEVLKKVDRLHYSAWQRSIPAPGDAIDIINYLGFYLRAANLEPWGEWGEPGAWRASEIPGIVTLCGSTRFYELFHRTNLEETLSGNIVLSIGVDRRSDDDMKATDELGIDFDKAKRELDKLHKRKIDISQKIIVITDESGYIGESTFSEISYAYATGKQVIFLDEAGEQNYKEMRAGAR